ncbi:MAG: hypothetical protein A2V67_11065 [Deltaproteobacteria bacterium RBG_13_61_14]|nr:MAG: hypothetical protein A2V67_11065 [Deltaproteobacteria bacterium RBG_13_61_14]
MSVPLQEKFTIGGRWIQFSGVRDGLQAISHLSANCELFDRAQSKPPTANRLQPGVVAALDGVAAEQNGVVAAQDGVVGVQNGGTFEEGISYVVCSMSGKRRRRNQEKFRQVKLVPG